MDGRKRIYRMHDGNFEGWTCFAGKRHEWPKYGQSESRIKAEEAW